MTSSRFTPSKGPQQAATRTGAQTFTTCFLAARLVTRKWVRVEMVHIGVHRILISRVQKASQAWALRNTVQFSSTPQAWQPCTHAAPAANHEGWYGWYCIYGMCRITVPLSCCRRLCRCWALVAILCSSRADRFNFNASPRVRPGDFWFFSWSARSPHLATMIIKNGPPLWSAPPK